MTFGRGYIANVCVLFLSTHRLKKEDDEEVQPGPAKRSRLGADPKAQQDRLEALNQVR